MSNWSRLLSQSAVMVVARLGGAGIMFLVQVAIARSLGQVIFGDFLLVLATTNVVAMLLPLGFQTIGSYFVADYAAKQQRASILQFVKQGVVHCGAMFVLLLLAKPLVSLLSGTLALTWIPMVCMALASALVFMSSATLIALKRPLPGLIPELIVRPLLIAGSFLLVVLLGETSNPITVLFTFMAAAYALVAITHGRIALSAIKGVPNTLPHDHAEKVRWWRFALPWVLITLATEFLFDLDLLHLSQLLGPEDFAVFGLVTRLFALAAFGVTAIYTITLPHVFDANAAKDQNLFNRRVEDANLAALGVSFAIIIVLLLAGPLVLSVFGPDFVRGSWALVILSGALAARSFFGPTSLVLSLHDRPYAALPAAASGLVLMFALNHLAVPTLGIEGAALAALAAVTFWSFMLWRTARRITNVDVSLMPLLKEKFGQRSAST